MWGRKHLVTIVVAVGLAVAAWGATSLFWDDADYRRPPERAHLPPRAEPTPTPSPECEAAADPHPGLCFTFYFTESP
jgi:hypothetical protein